MEKTHGEKVIVVGAGLGGISAAISLASEGFEIELYEKNKHIGGKLNLLQKDGFSFDLGPSILTLPHLFRRLFDFTGRRMEDYFEIQELKLHWRAFFEDGTVINLCPKREDMQRENPCLTSRDVDELYNFLEYSRNLYEVTEKGYFREGLDTLKEVIKFHGLVSVFKDFDIFSTMAGGVARRIHHPHLRDVLNFFIKYVGSSPYDAPAILNLLAYAQFQFGVWYVKGGMYNLARGLRQLMKELGVKIYPNSEVIALIKNEEKIEGIRLKDGSVRKGNIFISNMEVIPAYKTLLHEGRKFLKSYDKFEPACSGLVIHLGVDREYPQLAHHNFFFSRDSRKHFNSVFRKKILPEDPTIYLVAPTRTDKSQAPEGCENIKVLPHIPHIQDPPLKEDDYLQLRERVLNKLERMGLENLRKHIVVDDMWTPDDIRELYYSNRGAIYGVVSDRRKNLGFKAPKKSEKYENLYFVGGSVNPGGGMPMVILSGQQVKDKILKKYGK